MKGASDDGLDSPARERAGMLNAGRRSAAPRSQPSHAASLRALLAHLRADLRSLFARPSHAPARRDDALERQLLLGLELLWKIEEQTILPALLDAMAGVQAAALCQAADDLRPLRHLATLVMQTRGSHHDAALAVLEGMTALHFERVDELLERAAADDVDWRRLEGEVQGLLARWQAGLQ